MYEYYVMLFRRVDSRHQMRFTASVLYCFSAVGCTADKKYQLFNQSPQFLPWIGSPAWPEAKTEYGSRNSTASYEMITTTIRRRFDRRFDSHPTAVRPRYDRSKTFITTVGTGA